MKPWRDDEPDINRTKISNTNPEHVSNISPSKFYRKRNTIKSEEHQALTKILQGAGDRTQEQELHKCYTEMKNKRIAYKSITSLKKFPLQDGAMEYWNDLLISYLFPTNTSHHARKEDDSLSSSTSSLSDSTNWQKKRQKELDGSPMKAAALCPKIKAELAGDFIVERNLIGPSNFMKSKFTSLEENESVESKSSGKNKDNNNTKNKPFLPALWSLEPRIFAMETNSSGKRKYIVGHYGRFVDWYWRKTSAEARHYYELIPEKTPCRLFFDLEFNKQANPDITSSICEDLMTELIEELIKEIQNIYNLTITRSCILDLDSTTVKKFSRHFIVHLPSSSLFANATEAGVFVKHFVSRLADEVATNKLSQRHPTLSQYLFVNKEANDDKTEKKGSRTDLLKDTTLFVDLGVYTRNRLFRLMGSTKFGKNSFAALRIADANQFLFPPGFHNHKFYLPEMKKSNEDCSTSPSSCEVDGKGVKGGGHILELDQFRSSMDWSDHADALASTLVVPLNYSKTNYNLLDISNLTTKKTSDINSKTSCVGSSKPTRANSRPIRNSALSSENRGPSSFPLLDKYITDVLSVYGGVQGQIRCWYINELYSKNDIAMSTGQNIVSITYHINYNRYCENIGRCHKSNNIMWTVDFLQMQCFQSCWDPECKAMGFYRSKPVDLPIVTQEFVKERLFEIEISSLDESTFVPRAQQKSSESGRHSIVDDEDAEFEKALLAVNLSDFPRNTTAGRCKGSNDSSGKVNTFEDVDTLKEQEEIEFEKALLNLNI